MFKEEKKKTAKDTSRSEFQILNSIIRTVVGPVCIVILVDRFFSRVFVLFCKFQMFYDKCSNCVSGHNILLDKFHLNYAVCFNAIFWPIHIAFSSTPLNQIRYHHNNSNALLPNHSPEAVKCARKRSLCSNECSCLLIPEIKEREKKEKQLFSCCSVQSVH